VPVDGSIVSTATVETMPEPTRKIAQIVLPKGGSSIRVCEAYDDQGDVVTPAVAPLVNALNGVC
jgi:hypothetical protein